MKIVADANILAVADRFNQFSELKLIPGRDISAADLIDADALLVRSITAVNRALLQDSTVSFVATATSGSDHIDLDYLQGRGIGFADAKGSNANAVVDYCFAALAFAVLHKGLSLESSVVGIVGGGNVGGLFARKLDQLNIAYRICDPLLERESKTKPCSLSGVGSQYCSLHEALRCDVVSLHVPLSSEGDYPTRYMLNADTLPELSEGAVLINTCRGAVVDELALIEFLQRRVDVTCIFDVWENEPRVNRCLAPQVSIATPHIAGYSREAKHAATMNVYRALLRHFSLQSESGAGKDLGDESTGSPAVLDLTSSALSGAIAPQLMHWACILRAFEIEKLSHQFKQSLAGLDAAIAFDEFRSELLGRREYRSQSIAANGFSASQLQVLQILGFAVL